MCRLKFKGVGPPFLIKLDTYGNRFSKQYDNVFIGIVKQVQGHS